MAKPEIPSDGLNVGGHAAADVAMEVNSKDAGDGAIDIAGDGGLLKEVLTPGVGLDAPEKGDQVTVHYVGTLEDGTEFDSSRGRGEPFTFTLGQSQVIKGWDVGVATMTKGELARFRLRGDYAYGAAGSAPKIPPNATLVFEVELLSWKSDKDLSGDGGVVKVETLNEGEGWATPKAEDEVVVRLVARVQGGEGETQGAVVYESPEGGEEFHLREGGPVKALSLVLPKMKKGGALRLAVQPEYGFVGGAAPAVPGGTPLQLDVTLLGWKKVENVTPDGGIVKKTLTETAEWQKPNAGATVTVAYTGRLPDGGVFDERGAGDPLVFVTEEGQAPCEGFEQAVLQMKKGERALVTLSPAYAAGAQCAPADTPLSYDISLLELEKSKETWEMDTDEKLAAAQASKDKGVAAFKAGRLDRAVTLWNRAKQAIEHDDTFPAEAKTASKELKKLVHLNLAAAHLKAGRPVDARKAADQVLAADSFHLKALYRRAQSWMATADWVEAERDVQAALGVDPESADFKALGRKLKAAEMATRKKEAALWSGAFKRQARAAEKAAKEEAAADEEEFAAAKARCQAEGSGAKGETHGEGPSGSAPAPMETEAPAA